MSHDDYFSSELPDDPDAAFVVLEEAFRTEVLAKKMHGDTDYYSYMNRVLGAKDELQVKILLEYKPPTLAMIREIDFFVYRGRGRSAQDSSSSTKLNTKQGVFRPFRCCDEAES